MEPDKGVSLNSIFVIKLLEMGVMSEKDRRHHRSCVVTVKVLGNIRGYRLKLSLVLLTDWRSSHTPAPVILVFCNPVLLGVVFVKFAKTGNKLRHISARAVSILSIFIENCVNMRRSKLY